MSDRPDPASVLDAILARTRERVAAEQERRPLGVSHPAVTQAPPVRPFGEALVRPGRVNVIAEHKRRSPSRGAIREDLVPADVARGYENAGAAAISVLTDEPFFGGRMAHLEEVRRATALPVLRKDFVLDPWQVWEARAAGADAVLLIVAALTDAELRSLLGVAREAGLDALVEVHDRSELDRALAAGSRIVGVNNRDLKTLAVSLADRAVARAVHPGRRGGGGGERHPHERRPRPPARGRLRRVPGGRASHGRARPGRGAEAAAGGGIVRETKRLAEATRDGRLVVKICGITSPADARVAVEAGADALGFVFWFMSPRKVDPVRAAAIARDLPESVLRVGVFVDAPLDEMKRVADEVGLDLLQLHGDEPPEALVGLPRPALKAVRVGKGFAPEEAMRYADHAAGLVVDTRLPGETQMPGGTGVPFDWSLIKGLADRVPFLMLAGGLGPSNVVAAIRAVRPHAVDVSSGVEGLPGRKDPAKVRAFVEAARSVEKEAVR